MDSGREQTGAAEFFFAWYTLCAAGNVGGVLLALQTFTEYADEMRASNPFVGMLDADEDLAIRTSVRAVSFHSARCCRPTLNKFAYTARLVSTFLRGRHSTGVA